LHGPGTVHNEQLVLDSYFGLGWFSLLVKFISMRVFLFLILALSKVQAGDSALQGHKDAAFKAAQSSMITDAFKP
jgi:hypothetical protein